MLGVLDEYIVVVNHNPKWLQLFSAEKEKIKSAINKPGFSIEHIGSTAVTGLVAKPVIDIQLGINNWIELDTIRPALINLAYEYFGEAGVPGRHYFRKRQSNAFNVHVMLQGSELWDNNILIRDYLKNNKATADKYGRLKLLSIERGVTTLLAYSEHKNQFINELINKAKEL